MTFKVGDRIRYVGNDSHFCDFRCEHYNGLDDSECVFAKYKHNSGIFVVKRVEKDGLIDRMSIEKGGMTSCWKSGIGWQLVPYKWKKI